MKKVIIGLVLLIGIVFAVKSTKRTLEEPATGVVMVEDDPMINDMGGVDGTTVMTEEESMEAMEEDVILLEEPVVEEVVEVFVPLSFNGKLGKFAKANKGVVLKLPSQWVKQYGAKKGVRIGDDVYFKGKDGLYVFHAGEIMKLDGIADLDDAPQIEYGVYRLESRSRVTVGKVEFRADKLVVTISGITKTFIRKDPDFGNPTFVMANDPTGKIKMIHVVSSNRSLGFWDMRTWNLDGVYFLKNKL